MNQAMNIASERMQHYLLQSVRLLILLTCLSLAQPFTAVAQTNAPASLPPAAQEAVNKGVIAAKVPDYLLAIRYFEEARKIAPDAPVVYLNMGLAESKIPGRELRAIAWFGAYLAAYPEAPNATAVKEQMVVLEVRNRSNVSRLIKAAQDAAIQNANFRDVAKLWAKAGDTTAALGAADLTLTLDWKMGAQTAIAEGQIEAGDITGALMSLAMAFETSKLISCADLKSMGQYRIAEVQIDAGDFSAAQKTLAAALVSADFIGQANYKACAQTSIAKAHAQTSSAKAELTNYKAYAQTSIAKAQLRSGDAAAAQESLVSALATAQLIPEVYDKSEQLNMIARVQLEAGNAEGARQTLAAALMSADQIQEASDKDRRLSDIVTTYLWMGDIPGAQGYADKIQGDLYKESTQIYLRDAKAGRLPPRPREQPVTRVALPMQSVAVADWVSRLNDSRSYGVGALNTQPFLDLAAHLKALPPTDDNPRVYFDSFAASVNRIVDAQIIVNAMLKRQFE